MKSPVCNWGRKETEKDCVYVYYVGMDRES